MPVSHDMSGLARALHHASTVMKKAEKQIARTAMKVDAANDRFAVGASAWLLQVGGEVYPVYGNVDLGWTVERDDHAQPSTDAYRYRSIEEIFFALVNFSCCPVGEA
jgi:hypothetical protein